MDGSGETGTMSSGRPDGRSPARLRRSRWSAVGVGLLGLAFAGFHGVRLAAEVGPGVGLAYLVVLLATVLLTRRDSFGPLWLLGGWFAFSSVWAIAIMWGKDPLDPALRDLFRARMIPLEGIGGLLWALIASQWIPRLWRGESLRSSASSTDRPR